ncbi:MAG TPA: hypothetical protein PKW98_09085 [Candidatus Wallbacteria bacterium]|nr:hypothetical protein [Candidatus Wallbacteria bacterium]
MFKDVPPVQTLKRRIIIIGLLAVSAGLLASLIFFYRLSRLGPALQSSLGASGYSFSFGGELKINKSVISLPEGQTIAAEEITLQFYPAYSLLKLSGCDVKIFIGKKSAAAAYPKMATVIKHFAERLGEYGVNASKVEAVFQSSFECGGFMGFNFDRPFKAENAVIEYGLTGATPRLISSDVRLSQGTASAEISLKNSSGKEYIFNSKSLPLELFKNRMKSKYFDFNTAEIDLRFKSVSGDLSDFAFFYDISGSARDFSFIYQPFKSFLKADFVFRIHNGKLIVEETSKPSTPGNSQSGGNLDSRISGYVDFKNRSLSVEFSSSKFDLSYFSAIFSKLKNFLSHYSPAGYAKIFIKIEGPLENPETYAELTLSNAMLQGDAGYKNINNISGKLNFINSKISFNDINGSLMSSKVSINGVCDITQIKNGGDISVNFSEIPVTEVKDYMIFSENEIEKLISSASAGRLSVTLKLSSDSSSFKGSGNFSKCKLSLPVKNEILEISDAGGNFVIGDESIEFTDSYGFIGNVPFFFNASFSKKSLKNYCVNLKIQNIDFSEIIAGKSSYEFLNFISRIQAQNKSKLELKISSSDSVKISTQIKLKLSYPDISLYPLPFSINIENVDGGINFVYDSSTGAFELNDFDFALRGASKILLLSFLYRSIPVSISGNLHGDIHLSQKKVITGNFSISEGIVRYFDNKYVELFVKISELNAYFTVQNTIINGICKLKLLAGEARLDFKSDFASSSLESFMNFEAQNINLSDIYVQNPRASKYVDGVFDVNFKSSFNAKNKSGDLQGAASIKNGRFINLSRLDIISRKDIVPNRIYDFNKFNFNFSLNKDKLKIGSPVYDGADKEEFLEVLKNIDYGVDL